MKSKELRNLIHTHNKKYKQQICALLETKLGVSKLYTESNLWLEPHFGTFDNVEFTSSKFTIQLNGKDHTIIKYTFNIEVNNTKQEPIKKYDISDHIRGLRQNLDTAELLLKLIIESQDEIYAINHERLNTAVELSEKSNETYN